MSMEIVYPSEEEQEESSHSEEDDDSIHESEDNRIQNKEDRMGICLFQEGRNWLTKGSIVGLSLIQYGYDLLHEGCEVIGDESRKGMIWLQEGGSMLHKQGKSLIQNGINFLYKKGKEKID